MSFSVSFAIPRPAYEGKGAPDSPPLWRIVALCGLGRAHFGFARRRPLAEVRRAGDAAVVAGPALALRQRLLDAVEAPEPAAEVVDHVHECRLARARHDGRAVLELAVVRQDDVEKRLSGVGREARQVLGRTPHEVVA